ncbi:MAG: hypothetical protein CUN55_07655, partial [Phototrophicales bacterium]
KLPLKSNWKTAANQIAQTLNQLDSDTLYIDGFDGNSAENITPTILQIASNLEGKKCIVLAGRRFPMSLSSHKEAEELIGILQIPQDYWSAKYIPTHNRPLIEVRAFSEGHVWVNSRLIDHWEGQLPRLLFFFFIDRAMLTRDDIFRTFWPELSIKDATNVFHVTKSKINDLLGVPLMVYSSGYYRISPDVELRYDAVLFQEAIQNADIAEDEEAEQLYRKAINLYRHDFLTSIDADWANRRRNEMREMAGDALFKLAQIRQQYNTEEALGFLIRANAMQPQRQDIVRELMRLYVQQDQPTYALQVFDRLSQLIGKDALEIATLDALKQIQAQR